MRSKARGSADALIIVVLVLVIAVSAAWWVREQSATANTTQDFTAAPLAGTAPLTVTFSVKRDQGAVETVVYGDGTSADTSDFICGVSACTREHLYTAPGTYIASFADPAGATLASFTIVVGAP